VPTEEGEEVLLEEAVAALREVEPEEEEEEGLVAEGEETGDPSKPELLEDGTEGEEEGGDYPVGEPFVEAFLVFGLFLPGGGGGGGGAGGGGGGLVAVFAFRNSSGGGRGGGRGGGGLQGIKGR